MSYHKDKEYSGHIDGLIQKIRQLWNMWDISDGVKDDQLTFDAFYNGFMAPYFGCYRCEDTRRGTELHKFILFVYLFCPVVMIHVYG